LATKKQRKQLAKRRNKRTRNILDPLAPAESNLTMDQVPSEIPTIKQQKPLLRMPHNAQVGIPTPEYDTWLRALADRDTRVFDAIVQFTMFFEHHHYKAFGLDAIRAINSFVQLTQATLMSDLVPTMQQVTALLQISHLFNHLVAVSSYETTDGILKSVLMTEKNAGKIMFLQNNRAHYQMDQKKLFDVDPGMASVWFQHYLCGISSPTALIQNNLHRHLEHMDERWVPVGHQVSGLYFACTYHNPASARRVKGIMNRAIKARIKDIPEMQFSNTTGPQIHPKKHIAIITCRWHRNHAVYKSAGPLVEQLKDNYKLTLIWTGKHKPDTVVTDYFDEVIDCYFDEKGKLVVPPSMQTNDYDMVYFPDVGMSDESIWLSNCRIAPIQAMGYGHPDTSGDDSEIDYFIGGDIEKDATDKYAETMVLIPGLGQSPAWPTAELKNNHNDDSKVRINCVWGPDKYNHTLLRVLEAINQTVGTLDHEFHLFASPGANRYAALPSFLRDVNAILPNAIVHTEQEYYDYMENAEMHDFSINSFPFGGYNTIVESFYMGLPCVTIVGDRFYNRAGGYLNKLIGMEDLSHESPREVVNTCARLILEPEYLAEKRKKLAETDLKDVLFDEDNTNFLEAVKHIEANHPFTETKIIGDTNDEA
jgi:predicted O-linked N-acetylglucosamine transferase (SPINDLY family)